MAFRPEARGMSEAQMPRPRAVSCLMRPLDERLRFLRSAQLPYRCGAAFQGHMSWHSQIVESLRDRGLIKFDGSRHYRKLLHEVRPSVHLDFGRAARFASRSQAAHVAVKAWLPVKAR